MTPPLDERIIAFIRAQGFGITPRAASIIRPEIKKALAEAERRGLHRAAELCRPAGPEESYKARVLGAMAGQIEELANLEVANDDE